ncbi:two-component system, chemotaxis family, sensor kinase CheA [Caldanaerobius fijiensis DSM 17918]|uniref:Chemotaxis protein CheA n=1 Tax=Caldanaerobius fijiensis DSM 17918 TaxID=1121256 RepID=A0A1M5ES23_9THEO|nr:chemotaxis protein CheA [Caldanaerobius fijiensis]SHF82103.1 two-component system, chemotaxis family, sensor kinase CheA [Caldanaerobius fijiensis DSM 17918]
MMNEDNEFIENAKKLLDNIGFLVLALENVDEKDKAAEQILSKLNGLLQLCRSHDFDRLSSFIESLMKLIGKMVSDGKIISTDISDFLLDSFEIIISLIEKTEKEGLEILKTPELEEFEGRIAGFLSEMDKMLQVPVIHTDDMLRTISKDRKRFLRELVQKGESVYEVALQVTGANAVEIDVSDIFDKLKEIGEVVHIAADTRKLPSLQDFDPSVPYISLTFVVVSDESAQEIEDTLYEVVGIDNDAKVLVSPIFPDAIEELTEYKGASFAAVSVGENKVQEVMDMIISQQEDFYKIAETSEDRRWRGNMVINVLQRIAEYMGWVTKGDRLVEIVKANKVKLPEKFAALMSLVIGSSKEVQKSEPEEKRVDVVKPIIEKREEKILHQDRGNISINTVNNKGISEIETAKTLKVDQSKIDELMNLIGELIVANNGLSFIIRKIEMEYGSTDVTKELKDRQVLLKRIGNDLQDIVMSLRLLPVRYIFDRFPRMIREISRKLGKKVRLVTEGEETQIDKNIVTALYDPMLHIIRNAIDHGIEKPEERLKMGKSEEGLLVLKAQKIGDKVVVEVRDDGRGIDPDVVKAKAVQRGFISAEKVATMDEDAALELLFIPGFSTSDDVTELSGRGVGMDVIRDTVKKLGGNVRLVSKVGKGTSVFMELPVTMVTSRVLLVILNGRYYALPLESVGELVKIKAEDIRKMKGKEVVVLRQEVMPLLRLREFMGFQNGGEEGLDTEYSLVVLNSGMALVVDEFIGEQEIIVRPLPEELSSAYFLGAAILGDGNIVLVLNPEELAGGI